MYLSVSESIFFLLAHYNNNLFLFRVHSRVSSVVQLVYFSGDSCSLGVSMSHTVFTLKPRNSTCCSLCRSIKRDVDGELMKNGGKVSMLLARNHLFYVYVLFSIRYTQM